jgi:hypothetical protein
LSAQTLRVETDPKRPLRVKVALDQFLTQPRWRAEAAAEGLGLNPMAEWLRPPGSEFNGMKLAGTLDGQVVLTNDSKATGTAVLQALDWTWGEGNRLEAPQLEAEWKDGVIRLAPATLDLDGQALQGDCEWKLGELSWACRGSSKGHEVKRLQRWMKALGLRAEWVENLTAGQIRGSLDVAQVGMDTPQWKGQLELRNAELSVPELAAPVKISAASVVWQHERLVMPALKASAGGVAWTGSYRYEVDAPRPHRLLIDAGEVNIADVERLLGPVWRGSGFFSRAMSIGERKQSGAAEIEIRADRIGAVENLRVMLWRDGERLTVSALSGFWGDGHLKGAGILRLGGDADLAGTITGFSWEGGTVESDWRVTGKGPLMVQGTARLTGGLAEWISGNYKWESSGKVSITGAEGLIEGKKVLGNVTAQAGGAATVDFGTLLKMRFTGRPFAVSVEGR